MFETFTWITSAASLVGVVLNIRHDRRCFIVWGITNASWAAIDASREIWAQSLLQLVYCGLSVWGYCRWRIER